jgi:hypothetical protein
MEFYAKMQATANRLLKGKGQSITLSRQTAGAYDPATGTAAVTVTTQTAYGAMFEYGDKNIDGVLIKEGDKQLLLSAINSAGTALVAPALNDTVTINTVVYTVVRIKPLSPAGTTVLFDCNIRV